MIALLRAVKAKGGGQADTGRHYHRRVRDGLRGRLGLLGDPLVADTAVAAFVTVIAVAQQSTATGDSPGTRSLGLTFAVLYPLALILRRRWPVAVLAVLLTALVVWGLLGPATSGAGIPLMVALYTVAAYRPFRTSLAALAGTILILVGHHVTYLRTVLAAAAIGVLSAFIGTATGPPPWDMSEPLHNGIMWMYGTMTVGVLALLLGARAFTEEFRHSTIVHTFVADPGRIQTALAKAVTAGLAAGILAAVSVTAMALVAYAMSVLSGGEVAYYGTDATAAAGLIMAAAAWGVLGVGLGALVRQPVPAIVGGLLWLLVFENVAGGFLGTIAAFLPGKVAQALAQLPNAANGMGVPFAAALMSIYAVVLWSAGVVTMRERDVL